MYCARLLGVIVKTKAGIWKPGKRIHMQLRSKVGIIRVLAAVLLAAAVPFAATDAAERIPVNPLLFGNNLLCYSDNGFGIWDPQRRCPVEPMLDLACKAGITLWRYPGGCILHHFDNLASTRPVPPVLIQRERRYRLPGLIAFREDLAPKPAGVTLSPLPAERPAPAGASGTELPSTD
jgi:hypothetical protein